MIKTAGKYYTLITDFGAKAMLKAAKNGTKIKVTEFAVGDGGGSSYEPETAAENLKNEVWRGAVNECCLREESENTLIIKSVLPPDTGGFVIREMGAYDDDGNLIAICNTPETQKAKASDGAIHELLLSMEVMVLNKDVMELNVDPAVVVATKKDVQESENKIKVQNEEICEKLKKLTEAIDKIKEMLPGLAAPTAADTGKILKINADGRAVWAEDYGVSVQAQYPDFYALDYDVDTTDRKHIETVYEDGHKAVVDIADDGNITQTLYDADGVVIAQRKTTFSDNRNHITERKVDVNELGQGNMDG